MTGNDVLQRILIAADQADSVFDSREVSDWPTGVLERFEKIGLLREASSGLFAPCPNCSGEHIEPVTIRTASDGRQRFFISCPESLRVEISADMCRGWEINPDGLAAAIVIALDLKGRPKAIVSDRLWRLGRIPSQGKTRRVVLARRMRDADAPSIAAHVGAGGRAIVLVPHLTPDDRVWPGQVPAVIALSDVATVETMRLLIDGVALMEAVAEADALAESRSLLPVDPEIKKQVVRQQVKAENESRRFDDVLVQAYKREGSYRDAAAWLTDQLKRPISKDQVFRAVKRAGGTDAVTATNDSASVARTVASQSRDRSKNFAQCR